MEVQVYEGRRIAVGDSNEITVYFNNRHETIPSVTAGVEGTGSTDIEIYVDYVTQTECRVKLSANLSGYLHLHAFSSIVGM
jgi:hypothetical protein